MEDYNSRLIEGPRLNEEEEENTEMQKAR